MKLVSLLIVSLFAHTAHAAARFALVVGSNRGSAQDGALRWAVEDAQRVHDVLVELGGVDPQHAALLLEPSTQQVLKQLLLLRQQIELANHDGQRTELLVFYSGHGDAESLHLGSQRLMLADLAQELARIPALATVTLIDACRSGTLKRGRGKGVERGAAFDITVERDVGPTGRVTFTSAAIDEVAQESDELRGSFFTHHLISALRGAADGDVDNVVTLAELYRYTYNHTLASSHAETAAVQHPELNVNLEGEGELVMAQLSHADARLVFAKNIEGSVLIVSDRSSRVVAELTKARGATLSIALPLGRYRLQLRHEGRVYTRETALDWGGVHTVDAAALHEQALVLVQEKGGLFDPWPWALSLMGTAGSAPTLGSGAGLGVFVQLERRVSTLGFLALANLYVARAQAANQAWTYTHTDTRLGLGVGYPFVLGPLQLTCALNLGPSVLIESARRVQARRVSTVSGASVEMSGTSAGLFIAPMMDLRFPVTDRISFGLAASVDTVWLKIDGAAENVLGARGALGAHYSF